MEREWTREKEKEDVRTLHVLYYTIPVIENDQMKMKKGEMKE